MMPSTIDESLSYNNSANGYRGALSKYENLTPAVYADSGSMRRPTQKRDVFTSEDLQNYNIASIRVLPITDSYTTTDSFLKRKGSYSSNKDSYVTSDYIGFILVQAQESRSEKHESVPLAGDGFASFFYGANPSVYAYTGIALNTIQDRWRDALDILYRDYIRGSSAVKNKTAVQLKYDNRIVTGFLTSFTQSINADTQSHSTFQIEVVVTDVTHLNSKDPKELLNSYSKEIDIQKSLQESGLANKLLDSKKLESLRDYVRTSFIVPPPSPPKPIVSSGKRILPNCILRPIEKDNGEESSTKDTVINTGFAESTCTGMDYVVALTNSVNAIDSKIKETEAKAKSETDPVKRAALVNSVKDLTDTLLLKTNEIKQFQDKDSEVSKAVAQQVFNETKSSADSARSSGASNASLDINVINASGEQVTYRIGATDTKLLAASSEEFNESSAFTSYSIAKQGVKEILKEKYIDQSKAEQIEKENVARLEKLQKLQTKKAEEDARKNAKKAKEVKIAVD